jgi:hypothetical protein
MNHDTKALRELEQRYERLLLLIGDMQASIGRLQQPQVNASGGQSGGGIVYSMVGVVISAGDKVTGQTVNVLVGGSPVPVSTNATVYNQMQAASIATNTIMLGLNPDGTYSAISQSC